MVFLFLYIIERWIQVDLQNQVNDHEQRLRKLEESDLKQQIQLANIEKSQAEIKCLINENTREQQKTLNDFASKVLEAFTTEKKSDKEEKFYTTKQFWAIISATIAAVVAFLIGK